MGMDLKPVKPTKAYPRDDDNRLIWGRYNWSGWRHLGDQLIDWGHSDLVNYMTGWNDGELIPKEVCQRIGKAIEEHLGEIENPEWREYERTKALMWKTCGGYKQF